MDTRPKTTVPSSEQQQLLISTKKIKAIRKRIRKNRKQRRFIKKCMKRGMNRDEIQRLIHEYHTTKPNNSRSNNVNQSMITTASTTTIAAVAVVVDNSNRRISRQSTNKRKRLVTSASERSISQRIPKKNRNNPDRLVRISLIHGENPMNNGYRLPRYLKRAPRLLFQNLRLRLQKKLNTKRQQHFVYRRLQLLDQQYRLDLYRHLWHTYLTLGSEHQLWPNQVYKLTKSNDHQQCQQFVHNRSIELNRQYDQCIEELFVQSSSSSCPLQFLPLDKFDDILKDFVHLQQNYLAKKLQAQLLRYKTIIEEQQLVQKMMSNLTNEQKETIERLLHLQQCQFHVFEALLKFEVQICLENLPKHFDELENFILSPWYTSIVKDQQALDYEQKRYKIVQEAKRTWLNIYIHSYELQYQEYNYQYQMELDKLKSLFSLTSTTSQMNLFDTFQSYMNHRINRIKQEIYREKIPIYRKKLVHRQRHQRSRSTSKKIMRIHVAPKIIMDVFRHPFTSREIAFLSRGPTYVRPNQSALRPIHQREKQIDQNLTRMMNTLQKQMANISTTNRIPTVSSFHRLYSNRLRICLTNYYMKALPLNDQLRARRELKLVKSIRRKLKKYHFILRKTDKSGVFHIGHSKDYRRKAREYREKTGAYEQLNQNPYNDLIYHVTHQLNQLKATKKITEGQRLQMVPIREKTQLAYMYFLPKSHKIGTPLRPIINTIHAVTKGISRFLDRLIRPLFDKYIRQTTIVDGTDLLDQLQRYIQQGSFRSSTLFVTFDISNLYTMLPQEESLKILGEFLHEHHADHLNGISIETILELGRLVLHANVFVYDNQFYRQIIGGAMGSAFTLTLANIFMWKWEKQTILSKLPEHEFYGRYIDDVFFTWNDTEQKLKILLEAANQFHPNIKLEYQIGKSLPFLDLHLTNANGILSTSVYHKPSAEPIILSFLSDHPRHIFRNCIHNALIRAIRYSSTLEQFNHEQRNIRLMLLYNNYPSTYIIEQFQQFFIKYLPSIPASSTFILPMIHNAQQFFELRPTLLAQPSIQQTISMKNASKVSITMQQQNNSSSTTTETTIKQNHQDKFHNTIFLHCLHESRFHGLKREIHENHNVLFKKEDHGDLRLIVGHHNNPNLEFELVQKRPRNILLKDPLKQNHQSRHTTSP